MLLWLFVVVHYLILVPAVEVLYSAKTGSLIYRKCQDCKVCNIRNQNLEIFFKVKKIEMCWYIFFVWLLIQLVSFLVLNVTCFFFLKKKLSFFRYNVKKGKCDVMRFDCKVFRFNWNTKTLGGFFRFSPIERLWRSGMWRLQVYFTSLSLFLGICLYSIRNSKRKT